MRIDYHGRPAYALAVCYLDYQEAIRVEAGAMATMSSGIAVSADAGPGGIFKGLLRKSLGGESLFMGRYEAATQDAWIAVSPRFPGDIIDIDLDPASPGIIAEAGSLVAMSEGVDVDVRWAGMRNIVLREGATMLHATGRGHLLLSTYGAFVRHYLNPGQEIIVDTGHLVAYDDTVSIQVGPLAGLMTAGFTGEGLVAAMTGPGAVYVQTRAEDGIRSWLLPEKAQNRR